jgi:hypothetical protein
VVWLGIYPREEKVDWIRRLLGLPENIIRFSLLPIGHAAEEKPKEDRYNIERLHING